MAKETLAVHITVRLNLARTKVMVNVLSELKWLLYYHWWDWAFCL